MDGQRHTPGEVHPVAGGVAVPTKTPHQWTQEDLETLRREYGPGGKTQREVAAQLGLSPAQVSRQVGRMGLERRPSGVRWTPEEQQTLLELAERKSAAQIARIMGRTLHGVIGQMRKLNVSRRSRSGWYTLKEVAEVLGMTLMLARQFVEDGRLRATYHNGRKPGPGRRRGLAHRGERPEKVPPTAPPRAPGQKRGHGPTGAGPRGHRGHGTGETKGQKGERGPTRQPPG